MAKPKYVGRERYLHSISHHIQRRHNTIKQLLSSGIITIDYVNSRDNMSDPITKDLTREVVEISYKGMGLRLKTNHHGGHFT